MRVVRSGGAGSLRRGVLVQTNDQMRVCLLWLSYTHGEVPSFLTGFSKWRVVEFGLEAGSKPPKSLILLSHAFLFHPHHFLSPFSTKVKVLLLRIRRKLRNTVHDYCSKLLFKITVHDYCS
ncbi:hypothetical protein SLEP1_g22474 [Rubroshorea leprosula]|uniref:Uncharacterized protein n=1 Tax=Rubroshorea leprosula TaxID=152421 RepID=A0AAV5JCB8_9ROSI|nr:hypothetical protein SLEP1_g22474 [Rubroshorea leprosula]